jgi:hypothetical protein
MKTERAILESLDEVLRSKEVREKITPIIDRVRGRTREALLERNKWSTLKVEYKV